jgi:hypothetical protein
MVVANRADSFHGFVTALVRQHRAGLVRVVRREGVRADNALVGMPDDLPRLLIILAHHRAQPPPST